MAEEATVTHDDTEGETTAVLRRAAFVLFLLPVVVLYPLLYRRYRTGDGGDEDVPWFSQSPMAVVPGLGDDSWIGALGYGVGLVGLLLGVSYLVPGIAFPGGAILLTIGLVFGAGTAVYLYVSRDLDRELGRRMGYGIALTVVYVLAFAVLAQAVTISTLPGILSSPHFLGAVGFPFLIGFMTGNGYSVKREKLKQEQKRDGSGESEANIRTKPSVGTEISNSKGQAVLEAFAEQSWMAPDDLSSSSDIAKTRRIKPLRDIVRGLWVDVTRYEKTVPKPNFQDEKRQHRSDYDNRHNVAPSGFEHQTYTFFCPRLPIRKKL